MGLPSLSSVSPRGRAIALVSFAAVVATVIGVWVAGGNDNDDGATGSSPSVAGMDSPTGAPVSAPTATPAPASTPVPFELGPLTVPTPTPTPFTIDRRVERRLPQQWRPIARRGAAAEAGPTRDWPAGGRLGSSVGGSRWEYRGVLGNLAPTDEVVGRVAPNPRVVPGTAPLTGLPVDRTVERRAVVVKIDNVSAARPQSAINDADIVVEELVEGAQTRLAAVFHTKRPGAIGPVRSARSTDIGITGSYRQPVFANSGANNIFSWLIARAQVIDRGNQVFGGYWRQSGRPAPHDLFTSSANLLGSVGDPDGAPVAQFVYRRVDAPPHPDARKASSIRLLYRAGGPRIDYRWDGAAGGWRRSNDGVAHTDSDGVQVAPENVIVWFVPYLDSGLTDKFGEVLYEGVSVGRGDALVFTNGRVVSARWNRPSLRSPATLTDTDGNQVPLTPGRTWVALVAPGGVSWN